MTTGHATHFLRRLERTDPRETELALTLYRDPQAVSLLLHYIQLPEQYERVALSLNADDRGPFVVVQRDGSFVTCLGREMGTEGLYVVSHERLQHYRSKSADFATRIEMAQEQSGKRGAESLIDQLAAKGHAVSREDFRAASALQPVLKAEFLGLLVEMLVSYEDQLRALGRLKRANRQTERPLRVLWETYQMIGHLLLLALMDGRTLLRDEAMEELFQLLFFVYDVGTIHMASRALWAAGRVGKSLVPFCKQAARTPASGSMLFFALSSLTCLGLRHRRLKSEVAKALRVDEAVIRALPDEPLEYLRDIRLDPYGYNAEVLERPEEVSATVLDHLKGVAHESLGALEPPDTYVYPRAQDVPEDIAVPWALILPGDIRKDRTVSGWLLSLIPYLARSEAELFYLPRDLLDCMKWSWHPDLALHLLDTDRRTNPARQPATYRAPKIGRNEPCPCGSGKKFKKCHGAPGHE